MPGSRILRLTASVLEVFRAARDGAGSFLFLAFLANGIGALDHDLPAILEREDLNADLDVLGGRVRTQRPLTVPILLVPSALRSVPVPTDSTASHYLVVKLGRGVVGVGVEADAH